MAVSLRIIFDDNQLPESERYYIGKRKELTEKGAEILEKQFPDLPFTNRISSACTICMLVSEKDACRLEKYFIQNPDLGRCQRDPTGQYIRGAQERSKS